MHKKAIFVDAKEKVVLSDNMLIEKHLGDLGHCLRTSFGAKSKKSNEKQ